MAAALKPGAAVVITGVTTQPELNGLRAWVLPAAEQRDSRDRERISVRLVEPPAGRASPYAWLARGR